MRSSAVLIIAGAVLAAASPVFLTSTGKDRRDYVSTTITASEFSDFEFFAQYAGASYCENNDNSTGDAISCPDNVCPQVEANGAFSLLEFNTFKTDNQGFIAVDPTLNLIVLSFRGTNTLLNFIDDAEFLQTDCEFGDGCEVHDGFYNTWLDSEAIVVAGITSAVAAYPGHQLIITGHSLGAAVATIAAAYLRDNGFPCLLYTYGSPRVFNTVGADYVTNQVGGEYRITHLDDPVPQLAPIWLNYAHTSPEFWLYDGTSTTTSYAITDIKTCTGDVNTTCNGGTGGFDVTAHLYYFEYISACAPNFTVGLKARGMEGKLAGRSEPYVASEA